MLVDKPSSSNQFFENLKKAMETTPTAMFHDDLSGIVETSVVHPNCQALFSKFDILLERKAIISRKNWLYGYVLVYSGR